MSRLRALPLKEKPAAERDAYPALNHLVSHYFFQDYDIISENPDEIVEVFKFENPVQHVRGVPDEISRFIDVYGVTDEELSTAFTRVFHPEMAIYGWNHRTLREALNKIAEIISDPANLGKPRP